jgi:hypothetical protein
VFASDAAGNKGAEIVHDGDPLNGVEEKVSFTITTTPTEPTKWVIVEVVYFASAETGYTGIAGFDMPLPTGIDYAARLLPAAGFDWDGNIQPGLNLNYDGEFTDTGNLPNEVPYDSLPEGVPAPPDGAPEELPEQPADGDDVLGKGGCTKDPNAYCERILVELINPLTEEEIAAGLPSKKRAARIKIADYSPGTTPSGSDLDLYAYESTAQGTKGASLGSSTTSSVDQNFDEVTLQVTTNPTKSSQWVLIEVVYWVAPSGSYYGAVTF